MVTVILHRFPVVAPLLILVVALVIPSLSPPGALAQEPKAGVVTTLQGAATVARVAVPQELPLKFKDDVFYKDRISTKEQSIIRVLLGGKALITVRELSVLTITEEPGRAIVDLEAGKVALAVARQRMRPGESVEVRTPNAIAAVRGTVMVVEVLQATAQVGAGAAAVVTNVHCIRGECRYAHRGTHVPERILPAGQTGSVVRTDVRPPVPSPPLAQIIQGLKSDPPHSQNADSGTLVEQTAFTFTAGGPSGDVPPIFTPPPPVLPPPQVTTCPPNCPVSPSPSPGAITIRTDGCEGCFGSNSRTITTDTLFVISLNYKVKTFENVKTCCFNDDAFSVLLNASELLHRHLEDLTFEGLTAPFETAVIPFSTVGKVGMIGMNTLEFLIEDAGVEEDECGIGCSDTQVVITDLVIAPDPPLLVVRDGARYTSTKREPLFSFSGESRTFDSLLLVCCPKDGQPSSVSLAGPLMRATNSSLDVPFFLLGVLSGGFFTSSSTDPLVLLEGGTHSLGSAIGVFSIQGSSQALDAATGLTLGTDRSLQFGGELFRGDLATSVTTNQLLKVDTAVLEASAPLLNLVAGSSMKSNSDLVQLVQKAKVTAHVPSGSLVKLNSSTLTVNNGSLFNVAGGSALTVNGSLFSLSGGSTLNILNGSLLTVSGGSVFTLTRGSLGVFGSGTNSLNITNAATLCSGCSITTSIPNFGYPVLLRNGALASNVTVASGFTPFAGLNGSNTVKVSGTSGVVLAVSGPTSKVVLGP